MGTSEYEMLERLLDERFETLKSSMSDIKETQDAILHRLNAQELANASRESTCPYRKRIEMVEKTVDNNEYYKKTIYKQLALIATAVAIVNFFVNLIMKR